MVDLSFLEKFTKGNIPKMKKYITMYLNMAPDTFERMQKNIEEEAWSELAVNAHSLKPQAEYIGIAVLKEVMIEIESKVKNKQFDNLERLFEKAYNIQKESEILLQKFINND